MKRIATLETRQAGLEKELERATERVKAEGAERAKAEAETARVQKVHAALETEVQAARGHTSDLEKELSRATAAEKELRERVRREEARGQDLERRQDELTKELAQIARTAKGKSPDEAPEGGGTPSPGRKDRK